jgi:hypothetical protein
MAPKSTQAGDAVAANLLAQYTASLNTNYPDVSRGPGLLLTIWILLGTATIITLFRLYAKKRKTNRLYWDDWLMVLSVVLAYGFSICVTLSVKHGLGRHIRYLTPEERTPCLKMGYSAIGFGFLAPVAGRISFCVTVMYLTATDPKLKTYGWCNYAVIALQAIINLASVVLLYTQCGGQIDIIWDPSKQALFPYQCLDPKYQSEFTYFSGCMYFSKVRSTVHGLIPSQHSTPLRIYI